MSTRHDLPSGGWVELLDVHDLRAKHKRAVQRLLTERDPDHPLTHLLDANDAVIQVLTVNGTVPYLSEPLPSPEWLDDLTMEDFDKLNDLVVPQSKAMFPGAPNPDDSENPDSPTVPVSE